MNLTVVIPLFSDHRTYVDRIPLQRRQWISLKNQTDPDFELVGVDNASHDDVLGLMKSYFPKAIALKHPIPKQTVKARCIGVQAASSNRLVTLDSDCIVYPRFIEHWKRYMVRCPEVTGVGGFFWYNGIIIGGREWILEDQGRERIDYPALEAFSRAHMPGGRPCYPFPPTSLAEEDKDGFSWKPFDWRGGFFYSNAYFRRDIYLQAALPDADLTGYGHDDSLFGIRLKAMNVPVNSVRGLPVIHQCHRIAGPGDSSHNEDCKTVLEHTSRVRALLRSLQ